MLSLISNKKILSILKVLVTFGLALLLFWYLYDGNFSDTFQRLKHVNYFWVVLSMLIGVFSHLVRAYRWKLLMEPTGNNPTTGRSLIALFVGYLANLAVPRLGEISRCLVLKRTDQVPVTSSLGTVVSERVLDVFSLLIIIGVTVLIEFDKLNEFFSNIFANKLSGIYSMVQHGFILALVGLMVLLTVWVIIRKKVIKSPWWIKMRSLAQETWLGFISITHLKNPGRFWLATAGIWVLYYFMSYVVFFSMEPTAHLDWRAGLSLLVMGGLAMSAPVQGGIGAYHLLVSGLLIYYGVSKPEGLSFAFLLHSSQMVLIILAGLVASMLVLILGKRQNTTEPES